MIQVIAARYRRNLYFLQPTHPKFSDDTIQDAISQAPKNAIIILEDVDALFDKLRGKKVSCPLTFTGLLNALDGIANPDGHIFVMTTNFIEQLDDALIRDGRVDLKLKFPDASFAQLESMFLKFYPNQPDLAHQFAKNLISKKQITDQELKNKLDKFDLRSSRESLKKSQELRQSKENPQDEKAKEKGKEKEKEEKEKEKEKEDDSDSSDNELGICEETDPKEFELRKRRMEVIEETSISMAKVQQLFIRCRKKSAKETLESAHQFFQF